jgi:hypothetical protein
MKRTFTTVIITLTAMLFTTTAFSEGSEKPIVPAGPVYAAVPADGAKKDADARIKNLEREAREAKEKADLKSAKEKDKAEAVEAENLADELSR